MIGNKLIISTIGKSKLTYSVTQDNPPDFLQVGSIVQTHVHTRTGR